MVYAQVSFGWDTLFKLQLVTVSSCPWNQFEVTDDEKFHYISTSEALIEEKVDSCGWEMVRDTY